jgi:hypothetical protein
MQLLCRCVQRWRRDIYSYVIEARQSDFGGRGKKILEMRNCNASKIAVVVRHGVSWRSQ